MKVVIEIKDGILIGIHSDEPIELHFIDYDTEGLSKQELLDCAEDILLPIEIQGGSDIESVLDESRQIFLKEAETL